MYKLLEELYQTGLLVIYRESCGPKYEMVTKYEIIKKVSVFERFFFLISRLSNNLHFGMLNR